jgi:hypothetical protein
MWANRLSNNRRMNWNFKLFQKFVQYDFDRFCNIDTPYSKEYIL